MNNEFGLCSWRSERGALGRFSPVGLGRARGDTDVDGHADGWSHQKRHGAVGGVSRSPRGLMLSKTVFSSRVLLTAAKKFTPRAASRSISIVPMASKQFPKLRLVYFDFAARGEPIRLALHIGVGAFLCLMPVSRRKHSAILFRI